jgi:O-antigen/teichoic acid export membrane protein
MSIYTLGTLLVGLAGFLLLPIYSNHITPEEYAILNLLTIAISIATLLVDGGMNTAFSIKFYKVDPTERGSVVFTAVFYNVCVYALLLVAAILFPNLLSRLLDANIPHAIQVKTTIIVVLMVLANSFTNLLRLQEKAASFLVASLVKSVVMAVLNIVFLVMLHRGYEAYLDAMLISLMVVVVWGIGYFLKTFGAPRMNAGRYLQILKSLVRVGWPLVPNGLLAFLISSADKFILNTLMDKSSVGIYTMGFKFGSMIEPLLIISMGQAFMPVSYRAYADSEERYRGILKNVWLFYIVLSCAYLVLFMAVIDTFYHFFINPAFWGGCGISVAVSCAYFMYGCAIMLGGTIVLREKTYLVPLLTLVTGAIALGLNFLLIPRLGIWGSAVALIAAHCSTFLLNYWFTQRLLHVPHAWRQIGMNGALFIAAGVPLLLTFSVDRFSVPWLCLRIAVVAAYGFLAYRLNRKAMRELFAAMSLQGKEAPA